jgi:hypothetical protein
MRAPFLVVTLIAVAPAAALLPACGLPDFGDLGGLLGGGPKPECEHSRDCADDAICDEGKCRSLRGEGEGDAGEGEGEGDAGEGEGEGDIPPDPQGPNIIDVATNITTVRNVDSVIFTAIVTDPDGVDDVIGGDLVDSGTGSTYHAFSTSASEGSYEVSVSWNEMNIVSAIDFTNTGSRTFKARFFDVAGHVSEKSVTLTLTCDGSPACNGFCGNGRCGDGNCSSAQGFADANGNGLCGNSCHDLSLPNECGACGNSCASAGCGFVNDSFQCTCSNGFDCSGTDACFNSTCVAGASLSLESSPLGYVDTSLDGFFQRMCDIDVTAAQLICQSQGFSGGTVSSAGQFSDSGIVASCSGVSSIEDCFFFSTSSCTVEQVQCGGGGGGSFVHHTGVNGETFTNDTPSDTSSLQGAIDACNAHFGVTTCIDACPGNGCSGVINGSAADTCTCSPDPLVWNHGGTQSCFTGSTAPVGTVVNGCANTSVGSWD